MSDSSSGEIFMSECPGSNHGSSIENCPNVRAEVPMSGRECA